MKYRAPESSFYAEYLVSCLCLSCLHPFYIHITHPNIQAPGTITLLCAVCQTCWAHWASAATISRRAGSAPPGSRVEGESVEVSAGLQEAQGPHHHCSALAPSRRHLQAPGRTPGPQLQPGHRVRALAGDQLLVHSLHFSLFNYSSLGTAHTSSVSATWSHATTG